MSCDQKILCTVDEKFQWGKCAELLDSDERNECFRLTIIRNLTFSYYTKSFLITVLKIYVRYEKAGMTRLICGCTHWNSDLAREDVEMQPGVHYEVYI